MSEHVGAAWLCYRNTAARQHHAAKMTNVIADWGALCIPLLCKEQCVWHPTHWYFHWGKLLCGLRFFFYSLLITIATTCNNLSVHEPFKHDSEKTRKLSCCYSLCSIKTFQPPPPPCAFWMLICKYIRLEQQEEVIWYLASIRLNWFVKRDFKMPLFKSQLLFLWI